MGKIPFCLMLLYNIYLQIMVQKALSARSLTDAQGATILTGWIKVLPMFLIVVPGMISRVLFPNEVGCANPERVICTKIPFHNIFRYVVIQIRVFLHDSDSFEFFQFSAWKFVKIVQAVPTSPFPALYLE